MAKVSSYLILGTCLLAWNEGSAITPQIIPPSANIDIAGETFGVQFTAPGTLTVPDGDNIGVEATVSVFTTSGASHGEIITFLGSSSVPGSIGAAATIAQINAGAASSVVTFDGQVQSTLIDITGTGTLIFNGPTNTGAPAFSGDGTINLAAGQTLTGAITTTSANPSIGTLILNTGSNVTGAVGTQTDTLKQLTITGNASITGQVVAENISLGANTLSTEALFVPGFTGAGVINTTIVSDTVFGNIVATGCTAATTIGSPLTVNANVTGKLSGVPLILVCGTGGSNGSVVNVTSNNPMYSFTATDVTGTVTLFPHLHLVPPSAPPPTGSTGVIESLFPLAGANPGSDLATIIDALTSLSPAGIVDALLQMDPNVNGYVPLVSFNAMKQFTNLWSKHMGYGRCIYATGCDDDCSKKVRRSKAKQAECDLKEQEGCFNEINCENVENRFEVWGDAFGYFGHQNRRKGFSGYNARIFGGMVGFQAPVNQVTSVGLGTGYANSQVPQRNKGSIQTYDLTAYFSYDPTHFYVDAAFSFDVNRYKGSRHIAFDGLDRRANSHYYGQEYSGLVAAGYRFYTDWCGVITPIASLLYSYIHVNRYHEHGAGDLNLHVKKQTYNFLESSLGLKLSQIIQTSNGTLIPEVHGIWLHDFYRDRMNLKTTFSGLAATGGSFKTKGPSQDRNWGDVGAGISFITCSRLAFELVYNYEFGKTYHSQEGLLKITQRF